MRTKNWKRITAGALSICMMATCAPYLAEAGGLLQSPVTVHAETGDVIVTGACNNQTKWSYNRTTKTLTITGTGTIWNSGLRKYKNETKKLVFSDSVTEIDSNTFENFAVLEDVEFGGVKKIGDSAFSGCTSLKSLDLNGNLKEIGSEAFSDCKNLTTVTVGANVKAAYGDCFEGCDNLTSLTVNKKNPYLYANGKTLSFSKFSGKCGKNVTYSYNAKTKTMTLSGSGAMDAGFVDYCSDCGLLEASNFYSGTPYEDVIQHEMQTLVVGDKITTIGTSTFFQCDALKTVKLGKNVTAIGNYAFSGCTALGTMKSGNKIKSIGEKAFSECSKLNKMSALTNLTKIGNYSFSGCKKLKTFSIGKSVKSIGEGAFSQCASLRKLSVHKNNKYFSNRDNMLLNKSKSKIVSACFGTNKTCHIYGSVKDIDKNILNDSFIKRFSVSKNNSKYSSDGILLYSKDGKTLIKCPSGMSGVVNIGDSVVKIASTAFETCNNITQINIGENVQTMFDPMYITAKKLNKIQIPDKNKYYYETNGSLISKTNDALLYCYKIDGDTYTIPDSVKQVEDYAFNAQTNLKKVILSNNIKASWNAFRINADTSAYANIESLHLEKNYNNPTNDFEAFSYLNKLKEITVSNENPNYTSIDGVLYDKDVKELIYLPAATETYTIPESVTGINSNSKPCLYGIKNLTISNSITDATEWLDHCNEFDSSLESLHIGKNVSTLISDDFIKQYKESYHENYYLLLRKLRTISVNEENSTFKAVNNMLYSKDGSTFILCPAQTEGKVVLEKGVTTISGSAFVYCEGITDIVIPDTVSKIEDNTFDAFDSLNNIVIWVPKGKKDYYKSLFTETTGFKSNMVIMELEN